MASSSIERIIGRRVWDSRGWPTVEVEVHLASGAIGRAIAPAGASTGSAEAVDLRDGGTRLRGKDVSTAVRAVDGEIAPRLRGMDATNQAAIDAAMIALDGTPNKSRIGGNAMVATPLDDRIEKRFLFYLLQSSDLSETISGTAQPQITRQSLSPFEIPLPPLPEQRRIVAELDAEALQMEAVRGLLPRFEAKIQRTLARVWESGGAGNEG